jgi:hypothetical protein
MGPGSLHVIEAEVLWRLTKRALLQRQAGWYRGVLYTSSLDMGAGIFIVDSRFQIVDDKIRNLQSTIG